MPTRPLPRDRATLRLMLRSANKVLEYVEPLREQLNHQSRIIEQMARGDLSGHDFFCTVHDALQKRIARGGPDHCLLKDYLDLSEMPTPSPELERARVAVERRLGTPDELPGDRQLAQTLARARIDRWLEAVEFFVQKVGELQGRIIEQLDSLRRPAHETSETDPQPTGPADGEEEAVRRRRPPSQESRLDKWAVGLDERHQWQIFKRFGRQWRSQGSLVLKKDSWEFMFLKALADADGSIPRLELIRIIRKHFSNEEGPQLVRGTIAPAISRIRELLRKALGLQKGDDPIPWEKAIEGYRAAVNLGFVVKDEQGHPQFRTHEELVRNQEHL